MHSVYPWQKTQWQTMQQLIQDARLPHAVLLHGNGGMGKIRFAEVLAETTLCEQRATATACGFCKQCQLLESGFHPDLLTVETVGKGEQITVDQVRDVISLAEKTAQQGGWKVVIFNRAERMNTSAANALLKLLEEPPENSLLILVCNEFSRIMATIKSRCRQVKFATPLVGEVIPWLTEVVSSEQKARELLEYAEGRPLLALKLQEEGLLKERKILENGWRALAQEEISPLDCAEACSRVVPQLALDWLYFFVTRHIRAEQKPENSRHLFRYLDIVVEARRQAGSSTNPNLQLLWEELMMDWQAVCRAGSS